jgi:hypothetical protein
MTDLVHFLLMGLFQLQCINFISAHMVSCATCTDDNVFISNMAQFSGPVLRFRRELIDNHCALAGRSLQPEACRS